MSFTLAHLSDPHLAPLTGFFPWHWNAKRAAGFLNWTFNRRFTHRRDVITRLIAGLHQQAPGHIAITGDLVNIGLPAEYAAAAGWLAEVGPPAEVSLVPGNHDIYVRLSRDPGVGRWAAYMQSCPAGESLGGAPQGFPFVRRAGPLALIGLNSAIPTPLFAAGGRVGGAQLDRLAIILDRAHGAGLIRAILIHHPPLPGMAPPRRALEDAEALLNVLVQHGAELVLHGHLHRNTWCWRQTCTGPMLVAGIASASAGREHGREPFARYHLFRLSRTAEGVLDIELHARGLASASGPVIDLDRRRLTAPSLKGVSRQERPDAS